MIATLISFLGGSAFRMLWGEISSWLTKRQDNRQEIVLLELQEKHSAAQHARNLEAQKTQAELGIKVVQVAAEGEVEKITADAWREAVIATGKQTGIWIVDLLNGLVRPVLAGTAIVAWWGNFAGWWQLSENDWTLAGAVLGIYIADRTLFKRGK